MRPNAPDEALTLIAVGDISVGDCAQGVGHGVHTRFERLRDVSARYPFEHTAPLLGKADMVFGNLETVLSHRGLLRWRAASLEMRGHPDIVERLDAAGFNVLNVANNHMMQHGAGAFTDTVNALRGRGLSVVGVASADHRISLPQVVRVKGLRVTILGFAFEDDKYARGPVLYAFAPNCDLVGQIREARLHSDLVICSVHWGVEFMLHPSAGEEVLGRQLVDAGADLVLGHHPHVPRRVERYGRGLIAYSLGNFVFDQLWNASLRTAIVLRVTLSRNGVEAHSIEPAWIDDDYQPRPMSGDERLQAMRALEEVWRRPDWVSDQEAYDRRYQECVTRNRYESYRHFLRHVHRRPLTYTAQTLVRTVYRKAAGRKKARRSNVLKALWRRRS